jgi:hypothetical protein
VTFNADKMALRHPPMAFTDQGVAMLSSVMGRRRAIQVNIQIMRAFTQLRGMLAGCEALRHEIEACCEDVSGKVAGAFRNTFAPALSKRRIPRFASAWSLRSVIRKIL